MIGYSLDNINSKSFEQKLQAITTGDSTDHSESILEKLIAMHSSVAVFARNSAQLLKSLKAGDKYSDTSVLLSEIIFGPLLSESERFCASVPRKCLIRFCIRRRVIF